MTQQVVSFLILISTGLLSFLFWKISENPEIQEKIYKEIKQVIGERDPTYEDVEKLVYLSQAINETLRMFPPVNNVQKFCIKDTEVLGYAIPKDVTPIWFKYSRVLF
jgi:cytochrome P450